MISVVVPVYNAENNIENCIKSILKQTYQDYELILINDGSTDGSLKICQKYVQKDKRVRIISQTNRGVSETRNVGIRNAKGEYIQFIDSDDEITADMLELMVAEMQNSDVDIVICGYNEILTRQTNTVIPDKKGIMDIRELNDNYPNIFERFLLNAVWNKLYKKNKIKNFFVQNLSMGEDLIFNLEYMKQISTISFIDKPLYQYYVYENSLTRKFREDYIDIAEKLYLESKKFCDKYNLVKQGYRDISNIFIKFLFYGFSDLYINKKLTNREKKACLDKWIHNSNVTHAICMATLSSPKEKLVIWMVKKRYVGLLHLLMLIKSFYDYRRS